ncbi:unnamed protein product [Closterium sp. NIES-54]
MDEDAADEQPAERPRGKAKAKASPKASPKVSPKGASGRRLARLIEEDEGAEDSGGAAKAMAGGRGKAAAEARGAAKGRVKPRSMEADEGVGGDECRGRSGGRTAGREDAKGVGAGSAKQGRMARSLREDNEEKVRAVGKAGGSLVRRDTHAVEANNTKGHERRLAGRSMTEDEDDDAHAGAVRAHGGGEREGGRGVQVREQSTGRARGEGGSSKGRARGEVESGEGVATGKAGGGLVRCLSDDEEDADAGKARKAEGHVRGAESEQHSAAGGARQKAAIGKSSRKGSSLVRSMTEDGDDDADAGAGLGHGGGESKSGRECAGRQVQVREQRKGKARGEGASPKGRARGERESGEGVARRKAVSEAEEVRGDKVHAVGKAGGSLMRCLSDDEEDAGAGKGAMAEGHVTGAESEQHSAAGKAKQKAAIGNSGRQGGSLVCTMSDDEDANADTGTPQGHDGGESEGGREGGGQGVQVGEQRKGKACGERESITRQAIGEMENGEGVVQGNVVSAAGEVHGDMAHEGGETGGSLVRCLSDEEEDAHAAQGSTAEGTKAEGHVAGGENKHAYAGGAKQKAASANA